MPADTIREEHLKHRQTENCKFCCKSGSSETSNSGPGTTLKRVRRLTDAMSRRSQPKHLYLRSRHRRVLAGLEGVSLL